jgi:glutaredoxin 3
MSADVQLFTTPYCPYCVAAKRLLDDLGVAYSDTDVEGDFKLRQEIMRKSGQRTVPQIWIDETHVGGYTDLAALHQSGELAKLLQSNN